MNPKSPVEKFRKQFVTILLVVKGIVGLMAAVIFGFWMWLVLGTVFDYQMVVDRAIFEHLDIDWYPEILGFAVAIALPVFVLHLLWNPDI